MQFSFSDHAYMRVVEGDENGRRTTLTPDEVKAILASDLAVPSGVGYVFYSEKDGKCLEAVVSRDGHIITIMPADRASFTLRLLAERKVRGDAVLIDEMPPLPKTTEIYSAALIGIAYWVKKTDKLTSLTEDYLFNWFSFSGALFQYHHFLQILTDSIDANLNRWRMATSDTTALSLRSVGWRYELPINLPYELLGKQPPRP